LCTSFASYAHGAPQQFHQWKIFNVTRRLKAKSQRLPVQRKLKALRLSVKQAFFINYIFLQ
jgi:hypothetical protein